MASTGSDGTVFDEGIQAIGVCRVEFDATDVVELSLTQGDRVLITRNSVGGGWLEGESLTKCLMDT